MSIMGKLKMVLSWVFLIVAGIIGFASTAFASMAGQFSNCSKICGLWPWDWVICNSQNLVCALAGPLFQATYTLLLVVSVGFFILAYILFSGWDK